jgi:hypothetical protein
MPLTREQRHRLDSSTVLTLSGGCGPVVVGALVLGSGILPVKFSFLLLTAFLIGISTSVPVFAFGRQVRHFKLLAAGAIVVTAIASGALFLHFQSAGLEHATRYAETWAAAAIKAKLQRGEWPQSVREALAGEEPVAPRLPWPYLASCRGEMCKVSGYFVTYSTSAQRPHLVVARRHIAVEWNWTTSTWRKLSPD